jgi:hypothetical protein
VLSQAIANEPDLEWGQGRFTSTFPKLIRLLPAVYPPGSQEHDLYIAQVQSPPNLWRQFWEVPVDAGDEFGLRTTSPICGHCRSKSSARGTLRMYATRVAPSELPIGTVIYLPVRC